VKWEENKSILKCEMKWKQNKCEVGKTKQMWSGKN
jgi:hypothetical protein